MMKCDRCGSERDEGSDFCKECGATFLPSGKAQEPPNAMNCISCGALIAAESRFCKYCGQHYAGNATETPSKIESKTRICKECGRIIDFDSNVCQYCGHDYRDNGKAKFKFANQARAAGVINIIVGSALVLVYVLYEISAYAGFTFTFPLLDVLLRLDFFLVIALLLIPGVVAIVGGMHCLKRTNWNVALLGSVASLVGLIIPGVLSIILVVRSKGEFSTE